MRVLRTILGMLLLTIGLPALLVGAGFWAAMQHRDAGGAYGGVLQDVVTSGYAVVVDDTDALLRSDAPFTRIGDTRLRITAWTADGPAFVGIAPSAAVAAYLQDVPRQSVRSVDIGTGSLPVATSRIGGFRAPATVPGQQSIWSRTGYGRLDWSPSELRDRPYSLVIMSPEARSGLQLSVTAEVRPGWLNSTTWALLILGTLLVMVGMIVLAWPGRRREVVYVVEPSQVPDLIKAIGAPLPLSRTGGGRHARTHRPRTLADSSLQSQLSWPPAAPSSAASLSGPAPSGSARSSLGSAIALSGAPSPAEYAAATAIPATNDSVMGGRPAGERSPAPGEPLSLIGPASSSGGSPVATVGLTVPAPLRLAESSSSDI
jgi:hypothetical protein